MTFSGGLQKTLPFVFHLTLIHWEIKVEGMLLICLVRSLHRVSLCRNPTKLKNYFLAAENSIASVPNPTAF